MTTIVEKVIAGDKKTVARLIRDIDDDMPEAREMLKALYRFTGEAHVIGITGAPGVGKSTLVGRLISRLREKDKTVGVLCIDPTSPFSGGAILGDRVRMQEHSLDDGVFIRSLATRGHLGGLTRSTNGAINVLDAMGKDFIIVETVGVGQDEVDVFKSAHTSIVVVAPGMGDDIQAIKAGILEIWDLFVVNKADRDGVDRTIGDLQLMIEMGQKAPDQGAWKPPILKIEAISDSGVKELIEAIETHRQYLIKSASKEKDMEKLKENIREEFVGMVNNRLLQEVLNRVRESGVFERVVEAVAKGEKDPYSACDELILSKFSLTEDQGRSDIAGRATDGLMTLRRQ